MIDLHEGILQEFAEHCHIQHAKETEAACYLYEKDKEYRRLSLEKHIKDMPLTECRASKDWKKTHKPNNAIWKATRQCV